jgi:hypothetical protein
MTFESWDQDWDSLFRCTFLPCNSIHLSLIRLAPSLYFWSIWGFWDTQSEHILICWSVLVLFGFVFVKRNIHSSRGRAGHFQPDCSESLYTCISTIIHIEVSLPPGQLKCTYIASDLYNPQVTRKCWLHWFSCNHLYQLLCCIIWVSLINLLSFIPLKRVYVGGCFASTR